LRIKSESSGGKRETEKHEGKSPNDRQSAPFLWSLLPMQFFPTPRSVQAKEYLFQVLNQ
jgi:hypothetical protein